MPRRKFDHSIGKKEVKPTDLILMLVAVFGVFVAVLVEFLI